MHPQGVPELKRLQGNGLLTNVIGNPLDTTIALSHLIFEGTLDRFPKLRICAAHGGGYLPSHADRSTTAASPSGAVQGKIARRPTEYLKQLYFDSLVFTGEALRHLVAVSGVSQIVLGTDYPIHGRRPRSISSAPGERCRSRPILGGMPPLLHLN